MLNLTDVNDKVKILNKICHKICKIIAKPITVEKHSININVSIGAGIYTENKDGLADFINAADKAMYLAKKNGTSISFVEPLTH